MMPYFKPLELNLDHNDWRFLNLLSNRYKHQTAPIEYKNAVIDRYRHFFLRNSNQNYINYPLFRKIAAIFKSSTLYNDLDHVYFNSQISYVPGPLLPHIDKRTCVISIPLVPLSPIFWYKLGNSNNKETYIEIMQYNYQHEAVLLNTNILHGTINNELERIFFQIGGFSNQINHVIQDLLVETQNIP